MKIFLLTPVYETTTGKNAATPVVHYFAKEWVKQGHDVTVFHIDFLFPSFYYSISKLFRHKLTSLLNIPVPTEKPVEYEKYCDGVNIYGYLCRKTIPHARINNRQKKRLIDEIINKSKTHGVPDIIISHWENPGLDLLPSLGKILKKPTCLVLHSNEFLQEKTFGGDFLTLLKEVDIIGFRNIKAKQTFEQTFYKPKKSILVPSGVSEAFLNSGKYIKKTFQSPINNYIYIGVLMERKHPVEVLEALSQSYNDEFSLTYVGDGALQPQILSMSNELNRSSCVHFTGRISREDIITKLAESEVFIMISKGEIFGLVYLEAMAMGVIPIGSRGEGIDGVIIDGENGFLCKPGDVDELKEIIAKIKSLPSNELRRLSAKAQKTAQEYSDYNCAYRYIEQIVNHINKTKNL